MTPTFQEFYQAARKNGATNPVYEIRDKYVQAFGEHPSAWEGPTRSQFMDQARKNYEAKGLNFDEQAANDYYDKNFSRGFFSELATGVERGLNRLGSSVGTGIDLLGGHDLGRTVEDYWNKRAAENRPSPAAQADLWKTPAEALSNPQWWASGLGETAASMIPSIGTGAGLYRAGAGALASSLGMGATGGLLEALPEYQQARGQPGAVPQFLENVAGVGALNAIPGGAMFSKWPLLPKLFGTGLAEGVTEWAEEPYQAAVAGRDVAQAAQEGVNVIPFAAVMGMLGGGASNVENNVPRETVPPSGTPLDQPAEFPFDWSTARAPVTESAPQESPVTPQESPQRADQVKPVPSSAFATERADGLSTAFQTPGITPALKPRGFTDEEISALESSGLATDGKMSADQFQKYRKARADRLMTDKELRKQTATGEEAGLRVEQPAYHGSADFLNWDKPLSDNNLEVLYKPVFGKYAKSAGNGTVKLYHGTNNIVNEPLQVSKSGSGTEGWGVYFSTNRANSEQFGDNLIEFDFPLELTDQLLDLNKKMSEQSPFIRKTLNNYYGEKDSIGGVNPSGAWLFEKLYDKYPTRKRVSEELLDNGVIGIITSSDADLYSKVKDARNITIWDQSVIDGKGVEKWIGQRQTGSDLYNDIKEYLGNDERAVSEYLDSLGIKILKRNGENITK